MPNELMMDMSIEETARVKQRKARQRERWRDKTQSVQRGMRVNAWALVWGCRKIIKKKNWGKNESVSGGERDEVKKIEDK